MEAALSLPMPHFLGDAKVISVFVYCSKKTEATFQLFPPHAMLSFDFQTNRLLQFSDFSARPPFGTDTPASASPIGVFPHPQIAKLKPSDYGKQRQNFEQLVAQLSVGDALSEELKTMFAMLMEPAFASYYWLIAPPEIRAIMNSNKSEVST